MEAGTASCKISADAEVRVPVSATVNPGYAAAALVIQWDPDALVLKNVEYNADLAPANQPAPVSNSGSYRVSFGNFLATENFTEAGVFFTLVFGVADQAKPETYEISLSKPVFLDKDVRRIEAECISGSVLLEENDEIDYLLGDINDDGTVSVEDAQAALQEYVRGMAHQDLTFTKKQMLAGDINKDGQITVEDAQHILRYYVSNTLAHTVLTWEELLNPAS